MVGFSAAHRADPPEIGNKPRLLCPAGAGVAGTEAGAATAAAPSRQNHRR